MQPIPSTAEILALKALKRSVDKLWTDWAADMLLAGFDTENLVVLAGEASPYNQFELSALTDKVFEELYLDFSDTEYVLKNYAAYLVSKSLNKTMGQFEVLTILKDICIELDYADYLYDFYKLYFAKEDLLYSEVQYYWDNADRSNIDNVIEYYFINWIVGFENQNKKEGFN